jgi:hypothetical protein
MCSRLLPLSPSHSAVERPDGKGAKGRPKNALTNSMACRSKQPSGRAEDTEGPGLAQLGLPNRRAAELQPRQQPPPGPPCCPAAARGFPSASASSTLRPLQAVSTRHAGSVRARASPLSTCGSSARGQRQQRHRSTNSTRGSVCRPRDDPNRRPRTILPCMRRHRSRASMHWSTRRSEPPPSPRRRPRRRASTSASRLLRERACLLAQSHLTLSTRLHLPTRRDSTPRVTSRTDDDGLRTHAGESV